MTNEEYYGRFVRAVEALGSEVLEPRRLRRLVGHRVICGLPGTGAVAGVVERLGEGAVVQGGADAAVEFDGGGPVVRSWMASLRRVTSICWLARTSSAARPRSGQGHRG